MAGVGEELLWAVASILRPLVRQLLASGVPFGGLEARLRTLFVEVAEAEGARLGRRPTDSHIALVTGINRKEVRRLRSTERRQAGPRSFAMNYVTSLISRWLAGAHTADRAGRPRPLPYQGARGPSFMKLARAVTKDLAPRVLLDELLRSGAAELRDGDVVVLTDAAYVPRAAAAEQLQILGEDPRELIETILHNIAGSPGEPLLQRKVYYDNLGGDAARRIRADMRRAGQAFLRQVDRRLAHYDRDRNPKAIGGARHYAGIGVYFFEAPPPGDDPPPTRRKALRKTKRAK